MDWLYDNWWIVNLIPFLAINAWFVHVFERDEGPFTRQELTLKIVLYAMGLLVVIALLITFFIGDALDSLESHPEGRRIPPSQVKRAIKQAFTSALWALARCATITIVMLLVLIVVISFTDSRPPQYVLALELVFLIIASEAALYLRRRNSRE